MEIMKSLIFTILVIIALIAISCLKMGQNDYYVRLTGNVEIVSSFIPDTVNNLDTVHISAVAEAYDACWSDLNFLLTNTSGTEYTLQAFGTYESYGDCPEMLIRADTTIALQVTHAGLYRFHIYKGPSEVLIDTLIVK